MIHVALLAYACKSDAGSEPGAGFHWALAASKHAHVQVITRPLDDQTRSELESAGVVVHEVSVDHNRTFPQFSYIRWLFRAQKILTRLHRSAPFSLVHHVTYATDWLPTIRLEGVPLVWGPVGGSTGLPKDLGRLFSRRLRAKEAFRAAVTGIIRSVTVKWAEKNVTTLIAQNQDTARNYARVNTVHVRPNYVVKTHETSSSRSALQNSIVIVGRLIEMKGVHIAITAMALEELQQFKLHVIGDGPMRPELETLAGHLGVSERVEFHGEVPRSRVYEHLAKARCSLLLSTHDAAGWSAAESIAVGTPVHTWSHGGPAEIVNQTGCGTTTVPGDDSIEKLAAAIVANPRSFDVDMSLYSIESLATELRTWYEEATR